MYKTMVFQKDKMVTAASHRGVNPGQEQVRLIVRAPESQRERPAA